MSGNLEKEALIIKNLAEDLAKKCIVENLDADIDFCVFLIDLKLLQLSTNVAKIMAEKSSGEQIIENCVSDLKQKAFRINTLKLQFFWRKKYQSRDEIKKMHHKIILKNAFPLLTELSEKSLIKTVDKEEVYKKTVIFIVMFSGLGNPTQPSIIKETQAALGSIFKFSEIDNFLNLSKSTKEQQLIEFARLTTGIRLFNKDCKKGGEGIDDLPLILTEGMRATKERFFSFKDKLDKRIDSLLKALTQILIINEWEKDDGNEHSFEFKIKEIEEMKNNLAHCRQIELFLKDLLKDLEESCKIIQDLVKSLQYTLLKLHDVVKYRVAVATVQVFPLFLQLSNIWIEMQEEVKVLSETNNNFVYLETETKVFQSPSLESTLQSNIDLSEGSDISDISFDLSPGVKFCTFSGHEYLQYEGFCAWAVASGNGLLLTGKITIGILHYSNRFYAFSSPEAASKWGKDPKYYIESVLNIAKAKPELIKLLNLYIDLEKNVEEPVQKGQKPTRQNMEVQTELHPINSLIDRNYTFSEWELKRRAIKLAALTTKATKSQQTVKISAFQTDAGIQTTVGKNSSNRTGKVERSNCLEISRLVRGFKAVSVEVSDSDKTNNMEPVE